MLVETSHKSPETIARGWAEHRPSRFKCPCASARQQQHAAKRGGSTGYPQGCRAARQATGGDADSYPHRVQECRRQHKAHAEGKGVRTCHLGAMRMPVKECEAADNGRDQLGRCRPRNRDQQSDDDGRGKNNRLDKRQVHTRKGGDKADRIS